MTTAIDTQRKVNGVYKEAILEVLTATNTPLDREEFNVAVLGGQEAAELPRWIMEPYTPALAILIEEDQVVMFQNFDFDEDHDEYGKVMYALRDRVTDEQRANSDQIREEQTTFNWNDPTNWRVPLDDAAKAVANIRKGLVVEFMMQQAMDEAMAEAGKEARH